MRPVSFCLAEEAQDRKGGECPGTSQSYCLNVRSFLSKIDAGRDPRHKSRPSSGSASSNDSKDSNDNIAAANSESSTCLPDDHIVQLQTELGRSGPHAVFLAVLCALAGIRSCARRAAKLGELETEVAELRSANDLLRREPLCSDMPRAEFCHPHCL